LNIRQYILHRDSYTCQCCKGKSKDNILNIHHIESKKTGGNSPDNLVTLCKTCHTKFHKGEINLNFKRRKSFRDATFMNFMKWRLYDELSKLYSNVSMTFGYITNFIRIKHGLPKDHYVDARCISGNPSAEPLDYYFYQKKVRCHNRQIHKSNPKKGKRLLNQAPYKVKGFRLYDNVSYNGIECFIWGRRRNGFFSLKKLDGTKIHNAINYKKLKFLLPRKGYLIETRRQLFIN